MPTKRNRVFLLLSFFFLLNIFVVAAGFIDPVFGHGLLEEDRPVENITALFLFFAAIYLFSKLIKNRGQKMLPKAMQFLLVIVFIFMAGEEISWGQRIFNFQTTGFFKADNVQGETNFHNLKIDGVKLNKVIFTYGLGAIGFFIFIIAPALYKKFIGFQKLTNRFGAFLPRYKQTALLIAGLVFVVLIKDSRQWELWECDAALVIFWMVCDPINRNEIYQTAIAA